MKKTILILMFLVAGLSSQAAVTDQLWESLLSSAPSLTGLEVDGVDGVNWWCEVWNITDSDYPVMNVANTVPTSFGWMTALGGYTLNNFKFTATETDSVTLRLYDASTVGAAGNFIESATFILPDREAPIGGTDLDVQFDFTGQTWQAVPEPATALLFGIGGLGAFIVRRNTKKAQEEADA